MHDRQHPVLLDSPNRNYAAAPSRATVRIPTASGDDLAAWLYLPEGDGPYPAVVMAHGIGAIKAGGLAPFAEQFCREGFAAVVFDYRQWGGSAGQPREELSFPRQREDYGTVIGWAAAHPDIDARRSFAWGTSFAGMYIVELAVSDSRLAGAIAQAPLVDGFAAATMTQETRTVARRTTEGCIAPAGRVTSRIGAKAEFRPALGVRSAPRTAPPPEDAPAHAGRRQRHRSPRSCHSASGRRAHVARA